MSTDVAVAARYPHAQEWAAHALRRLRDCARCPVCNSDTIVDRRCTRCRSDFTSAIGAELWDASEAAAAALEARQATLQRVPLTAAPTRSRTAIAPASPTPAAESAASKTTVQSVLALAGASLVAVAALVFTFFTPDLSDHSARSAIVGAITVLFLIGAGMLSHRQLRFSAEAVGGLALVFLALDVWAFAVVSPAGVSSWVFAAIGTVVAGAALLALSMALRVRVWLWASLLALAFVPVMLGAGASSALGILIGLLTAAGASLALIVVAGRFGARFAGGTSVERITLTVAQFGFVAGAVVQVWVVPAFGDAGAFWLMLSAVLVTVAVVSIASAGHPAGSAWSAIAGLTGVLAITVLPLGVAPSFASEWYIAMVPAASAVGLVVIATLTPMPRRLARTALVGGAVSAVIAVSFVPATPAFFLIVASIAGALQTDGLVSTTVAASVIGLCALTAGLGAFVRAHSQRHPGELRGRSLAGLAEWFAVLAALTLISAPDIPAWGRITIALALAVVTAAALIGVPRLRNAALSMRVPLIVGAHLTVVSAALMSWQSRDMGGDALVIVTGAAVVVVTALLARTVVAGARFLHVGAGYSYALVIIAYALLQSGIGPVAALCLTTSIGGIAAIVATFADRISPRSWYAILAVTAVPFALAVLQVVVLRSGWTAVSTTVIFLLALTLVLTRRAGLGVLVRGLAAVVLVPSLAVVVVCLGAELLATSGSPVVLPVIAMIVAVVLPLTRWAASSLASRIGERDAGAARLAVETSTLLTASIAVLLSLTRDAAGLWTTLLVLVILGLGFTATAVCSARRYGWWLAGAAFSGALWCVWALLGVNALEAYLLPPTVGAAVVGAALTARGAGAVPLFAVGLTTAVAPVLGLLALGATGPTAPWRAGALVAASWILLAVGARFGRSDRLRALRTPTLAVSILAATASAVQGARWGLGLDSRPDIALALVAICLVIAAAGAVPAALSARTMRRNATEESPLRRTRWLYAPAVLIVAVAAWPAIERDWFTIWTMWALMLAFLCIVVVTATLSITRTTGLPPVWFTFGIAFVTAVVAWSPRDLRVEWFSLPLGAFLLAAGALAMRRPAAGPSTRATLSSWPAGWSGSWALLSPGLIVMMSASIAATYTDPLTWRAILVIVLALVAILIGAGAKLAAPFLIGIVVLPVENVFAFLVQIGRGIESMPWWITLAVVGAVLLIIAVTYERRAGADTGIVARLRDLA